MSRLSDFRTYTNGLPGAKATARERDHQPSISAELANARTMEERRDIFVKRLDLEGEAAGPEAQSQFEADCEKVGDLLERNDGEGLLKHGSRHTRDRAEARAETIRSGQ